MLETYGETGAGEMAYRVKAIAAESNNLSLISRTVVVERGNRFCQVILQPPYTYRGIHLSSE